VALASLFSPFLCWGLNPSLRVYLKTKQKNATTELPPALLAFFVISLDESYHDLQYLGAERILIGSL
jgi:hypothetical protein